MPSYELNDWKFIWETSDFREGDYDITILAHDEANNLGKLKITVELEEPPVDQEIPTVKITAPEYDVEFNTGEIVSIHGEASDDMTIAKIELSLDSKLTWFDITNSYQSYNISENGAEITHGTWYYDWNTAGLDIGNYIIYVRVFDGVDNSDSDLRSIILKDGQAPQVSIDTPASGKKYQSGQLIKLSGKVRDNIEIEKVRINIDSTNIEEEISKNIIIEDEDWYYDWITAESYPDGKYTITITATDVGGNEDSDSVTVELTQPSEDKEEKFFIIPGFEIVILISAMLIIMIFRRNRKYVT
jgi:hypothetical protein